MPPRKDTRDRSDRKKQDRTGRKQIRTGRKQLRDQTARTSQFAAVAQSWNFARPCPFCGFLYLKSQSTQSDRLKCCKGGYAVLDDKSAVLPLRPLPDDIKALLFSDIKHFSGSSALYNRMLSIADTQLENGRGGKIEHHHGDSAYTVNGAVTYFVRRDAMIGRGGLSYFTFDGLSRLREHGAAINGQQSSASAARHGERVRERYLDGFFTGLRRDNMFCAELQKTGDRILRADPGGEPIVQLPTDLTATINNENNFFEVAAFTADNVRANRSFRYRLKGASLALEARHKKVEALVFPLLFWHGDDGYYVRKVGKKTELYFNDYMRARLLVPEPGWCLPCTRPAGGAIPGEPGSVTSEPPLNPFNRFQLMSRLGQAYAVETVSRAQDYRLGWHRGAGKSTIFGTKNAAAIAANDAAASAASANLGGDAMPLPESCSESSDDSGDDGSGCEPDYDSDGGATGAAMEVHECLPDDADAQTDGAELVDPDVDPERETFSNSSPSFLNDSFTGGPRHLKKLAKNALVIVSELGPPSVFITLTCNAKDPAIVCRLLPGQSAFDRPEIVVQVWRAQLGAFLDNLRQGKYLGGTVKYIMYVIEYQHRGLPHAHVVCKIDGVPEDRESKLAWISKHIQARFPPPGSDVEYATLIMNHELHHCSAAVNGCLSASGVCKRGYQDLTTNAESSFTERGYPVYLRPTAADLKVVPHNREMLLDWRGHLNVEFCGQTYAVLYLYKYLFKGNQKVSLHLNNTADVHEKDEIKLVQRGRMLCSMQALWFVWGYQNYPATEPSAKLIKAKLPSAVRDLAHDGKVCDLAIYFARPVDEDLRGLTYAAFFAEYDYKQPGILPPAYAAKPGGVSFMVTVCQKEYATYKTREKHIVRMGMVPFSAGEIFWLRVLLYRVPAYSFEDLYTVEGVRYLTFQEAALRRRLIEDEQTATDMFQEASWICTPHQMRLLFTNMTLQGFPTLHLYNDPILCRQMYQDFMARYLGSVALAINRMLVELAKLFKMASSARLSDYGIPEPMDQDTELQVERLAYDVASQRELAEALLADNPLTDEMRLLFNDITGALEDQNEDEPFIAILQGIAGAGKSTFVKYVMAYIRSLGFIAKGCASTGLAASVYDDFSTAHSLFAIPVVEDEEDFDQESDLQCNLHLKKNEERRELLDAMKFCAWDEASSQHMRDIRAVMSAMRGFRGKILLFVGDGLQITPVVPNGSKAAICASSIYCSELMRTARYYQFTKVLRLQNADADPAQANYARLLHGISRNCVATEFSDSPPFHVGCEAQRPAGLVRLYIPNLCHCFCPEDCVQFCFPSGFNTNIMHMSCILAATNAQVDYWNAEVQLLNTNATWSLLSKDIFDECDDPHGYLKAMVTEEVMNKFDDPGSAPPHELKLKVHDICILMRAVSKADKLATNTRVRITGISEHLVRVSTLDVDENFR